MRTFCERFDLLDPDESCCHGSISILGTLVFDKITDLEGAVILEPHDGCWSDMDDESSDIDRRSRYCCDDFVTFVDLDNWSHSDSTNYWNSGIACCIYRLICDCICTCDSSIYCTGGNDYTRYISIILTSRTCISVDSTGYQRDIGAIHRDDWRYCIWSWIINNNSYHPISYHINKVYSWKIHGISSSREGSPRKDAICRYGHPIWYSIGCYYDGSTWCEEICRSIRYSYCSIWSSR